MRYIKLIIITLLSFSLLGAAQTPLSVSTEDKEGGILSWLYDCTNNGITFLQDKKDILELTEALMHIPYVASINSSDPKTIKLAATLAEIATSTKLVSILGIPQHVPPVKIILWDVPKVLCYVAAGLYDIIRVGDAEKVAEKNVAQPTRLKSFKVTQIIQLTVEILLRTLAIVSRYDKNPQSVNAQTIHIVATELADIVGMWRLLGRYTTYFMYVDEFAINLVIKKKLNEDEEPAAEIQNTSEQQHTNAATTPQQDLAAHNTDQTTTSPTIEAT